ncbi:hypothetical protein [Pararhodospirillum photometricum]|uniref:hypothetical protein n=1 Tax=Pararhodospirillum photometricum TaxID=1084 RepID=UPI0012FED286|nr:hypothetical protein [Pararhodospirillum photometricum]
MGLMVGLAACASSPAPQGTPQDEARRAAETRCKRFASQEADRRSGALHGEDVESMNSSDPRAQMAAYDARRIYDQAFSTCLSQSGYARPRGPGADARDAVESARDRLRW